MSDTRYWQRWCTRAIALAFETPFSNYTIQIEPDEYPRTENPVNSIEIRVNRFSVLHRAGSFYKIIMDVNILVQTVRVEGDSYYDHPDAVGLAIEAMSKSINVDKIGKSGDGSLLGCLLRDDEIITIPYSPPSAVSPLSWTTLETTYVMDLEAT